jgi:hypothetical protein
MPAPPMQCKILVNERFLSRASRRKFFCFHAGIVSQNEKSPEVVTHSKFKLLGCQEKRCQSRCIPRGKRV